MALGVDDVDEIGAPHRRAGQAGAAGRLVGHPRRPGQADAAQVRAAEAGEDRALPGDGLQGRRRRPRPAARPADLARRRRHLPQLRAHPHQASRRPASATSACTGCSSTAATRSACTGRSTRTRTAHHAVAERLGQRLPVAIAIGCDPVVTYAASAPAARRHRRVPVRRLPARRAGRDGRLPHRAAAGAGERPGRAGGLRRAGRAGAGGPVRRPHRLLHAGRAVPGAARRVHDDAARTRSTTRSSRRSRRRRTARSARPPSASSCR